MDRVVDRMVDMFERTGVGQMEALLRAAGGVPPPTVYLLSRPAPNPYLGNVAVGSSHRLVADAADRVAELGRLPSIAQATRLLVVWECQDLLVSARDPRAADCPNGLVAVDAGLSDHVVRWHPAHLRRVGEHGDAPR